VHCSGQCSVAIVLVLMYVAELYDCDGEDECKYQSLSGCIDFADYLLIIRYCCRMTNYELLR